VELQNQTAFQDVLYGCWVLSIHPDCVLSSCFDLPQYRRAAGRIY